PEDPQPVSPIAVPRPKRGGRAGQEGPTRAPGGAGSRDGGLSRAADGRGSRPSDPKRKPPALAVEEGSQTPYLVRGPREVAVLGFPTQRACAPRPAADPWACS